MSATIKYKGNTIATASNNTKTLLTAGKYMEANVVVTDNGGGGGATLQTKSVTYTPSASQQTDTITPDYGYDGLDEVDVTVNAVSAGSATTPATTITANPTISISGNSVSASVSKTQSITPTVSAGYVSSGTAGNVTVSGSDSATIPNASAPYISGASISNAGALTTDFEIDYDGYINAGTYEITLNGAFSVQGAQTIHPSTSDQTIASSKYLTGTQTIKGVVVSSTLAAGNIKKDVTIKIGDSADDDRIVSVTGTYEGGGGGISVDGMADGSEPSGDVILNTATSIRERAFNACTNITSIHAKNVTSLGQYIVSGCTSLTTFVSESQTTGAYNVFSGAGQLTAIDFDHKGSPSNNFFQNCASLTTLVLRRTDAITALGSTGAFNGTPFRSGGSGGTIYVPQALLSTYPTASNWSTINGYGTVTWKSIESTHTDPTAPIDLTLYYADGTAI